MLLGIGNGIAVHLICNFHMDVILLLPEPLHAHGDQQQRILDTVHVVGKGVMETKAEIYILWLMFHVVVG